MSADRVSALPWEELREATVSGVRWTAIARVTAEFAGFTSAVVLAHLIPPAEFGRVAIALIIAVLATGLTNEGFGNPLVQRRSLDAAHVESGTLLSLAFGGLMTVASFLLAPVVATPLFGARTAELLQLASPLFLVAALRVVPYALLQRRLDFRRIGLIDSAAFLVGTLATVGLALAGVGGESIVLGFLINGAIGAALCFAAAPSPLPRWHTRAVREVGAFGLPAALASLVHASFRNVDYAIIGARLSAAQVGFYYRAFGFAVNYPNRMSAIMARVAFPIYSRAAQAEEMHALRERYVRVQVAVLFPVLTLLIATAPVAIPWLLGQRWEPAVVPMQILTFAAMTAILFETMGPLMLAAGKVRSMLGFNVVGLVLYIPAVYLATPYGLRTVCVAVVGVHVWLLIGTYYFLLHRTFGLPMRRLWSDVAPGLVGGVPLFLAAFALTESLTDAGLPVPVVLASAGLAGAVSYLLVIRVLFPTVWSDLVTLVLRVVLARKRAPDTEPERATALARVPAGAR
jgi:O-antigen/teichoic acid export membrane protein